ncbi:MAG: twin-arginine translocation signal domain-containing protein [Flavobacteriales bacterium]|nr:twin-arginine translocation signal domain-containing protein [Flavobacteriales bacterium]
MDRRKFIRQTGAAAAAMFAAPYILPSDRLFAASGDGDTACGVRALRGRVRHGRACCNYRPIARTNPMRAT